jgi:hypothetical protein
VLLLFSCWALEIPQFFNYVLGLGLQYIFDKSLLPFQMTSIPAGGLKDGGSCLEKEEAKGIKRPEECAIQSLLVEEEHVKQAKATRIRQAHHRFEIRQAKQLTQSLASRNQDEGDDAMTERTTNRVSKRLAAYVFGKLRTCPGHSARSDVMEKLLNHNTIWPFLPGYYPRSTEAKAIFQFVESFRFELQAVKKGNSRGHSG